MSTIFMVVGVGPNNLEIPLVPFSNLQAAEEFVGQFPKDEKYPKDLHDDFVEVRGEYRLDDVETAHPLYEKLFKDGRYYSGCGGCYKLRIAEVEFGQPMVGWDLD